MGALPHLPMSPLLRRPRLVFAKRGANPPLRSIEHVRAILRQADVPMSREFILRALSNSGHSISRESLSAIIAFFEAEGAVAEGSKGAVWVPNASGRLAEAIRKRRRL